MSPLHLTGRIHAVTLAGGSAFGLEAASGVRHFLEQKGIGYETGAAKVPLVPAAILYDLVGLGKPNVRPTREMGEAASAAATDEAVQEGAVGAGTGATVGKLFGMSRAMKSGIGSASVSLQGGFAGVMVAALAAVNAVGDVCDPGTGEVIAGARQSPERSEFSDSARQMILGATARSSQGENTTLVVVVTNARLSKVQATKLAQMAGIGMARTIRPVWTMSDGDVIIALSLGDATADMNTLGVAAADAVAQAIVRAVRHAPTLGGVPGLAD